MNLKNKGFTLIELIVVITILAILGTIGVVSFLGYIENSRDSVRVADIGSIQKALELSFIDIGDYPIPDNPINVVYSGSVVWIQGTVGEKVVNKFNSISDIFVDPLTKTEYSYSITNDKKEYQIGAILESNLISFNIMNNVNAGNKKFSAYVVGNYNGKFTQFKKGLTTYIFDTPTILTSDLSDPDITTIFQKNLFVFNGFGNISDSYKGNDISMTGGFIYGGTDPLLFSGPLKTFGELSVLKNFIDKYKVNIGISDLKTIEPYKSILGLSENSLIVAQMIPVIAPEVSVINYVYPIDPWTWNTEKTLACKRNTIGKIECKWEGLNIDTTQNVSMYVNNNSCEPLSIDKLNGPTILERDITAWCGSSILGATNIIQINYTDTLGNIQMSSSTLDIRLTEVSIDASIITSVDATGFNFDLSSLAFQIDRDYAFGISNDTDPTTISNCDTIFVGGTNIGRVDIKENCGGIHFGVPIPGNSITNLVIRDAVSKVDLSTTAQKVLGTFDLTSSYFTANIDSIDFDLTLNPQIQDLLDASGYTIWIIDGSGTSVNCTNRIVNPQKTGKIGVGGITCDWLFTGITWNYDLYLTYGTFGNDSFNSNTINLSY